MKMNKWLGLLAVMPTQGLIFLDQTVLPVALPTIQKEFGASDVALEWTVNSYLLLTAMFALFGGKISDRIGHKMAMFLGLCFFCISSILCGVSPNIGSLIAARALQGLSAAFLIPSISPLFASLFPENQRGRALGLLVSISSVFLILGPLLGGYLTESASWRWIFWINVPLCGLGVLLGYRYLPNLPPRMSKIDLKGLVLFAIVSASLILFFMQGREWGWSSMETILCAAVFIISLPLLLLQERRSEHPFMELALFKRPLYSAININISITQFVLMISVFRAIYLQEILGFTPAQTGFYTFLSSIPVLFFSSIGGYIADKVNSKFPIALGYICMIVSFFWLAISSTPSVPSLLTAFILFGVGIPLVFTPSYSTALKSVPPEKIGIAFGMTATLRMLAATVGIALMGLFIDSVAQSQLAISGSKRTAQIDAFSAIHYTIGALLTIAFIATMALHSRKAAHHLPASPAEGWD